MSIYTINATEDSDEFSVLCYELRAIVYEIEPILLPTVDLQTGLQEQKSHRKRRRSSVGEQSPLRISDIPRNKLGRFETRTRVTHANMYVPPTSPSILPPAFKLAGYPVPTPRDVYVPTPQIVVFSPDDTLTTPAHTRPTWSSSSPRQCSACLPSASQSSTLGVLSVVHVVRVCTYPADCCLQSR